jgi:hypothetical protein
MWPQLIFTIMFRPLIFLLRNTFNFQLSAYLVKSTPETRPQLTSWSLLQKHVLSLPREVYSRNTSSAYLVKSTPETRPRLTSWGVLQKHVLGLPREVYSRNTSSAYLVKCTPETRRADSIRYIFFFIGHSRQLRQNYSYYEIIYISDV